MINLLNKKKNIKETNTDDKLKSFFHLGETMMVDKGFDIRNYLNLLEKERFERNKNLKKFNILNVTSQFSTFNTKKKSIYESYLTTFNSNIQKINKKLKKNEASFSTDLAIKKYLNTASSTNLNYTNNITNSNYHNFISTKNSSKLMYNIKNKKNISASNSNETFNIFKAIKEIKNSKPNLINNRKFPNKKLFLTKISKRKKTEPRPPIYYSKKYLDTVFDSKNLINRFNFRRGLELERSDDLNRFPSKKKEISVKNALIYLLNHEAKKLSKKEKDFESRNENNKNIIEENIKEFEELIDEHKQICKNVENTFDKIQEENNNLLKELIIYKSLNKNNVDEIQKLLEQIENLRLLALFVHQSLEKDPTRYAKSIFPDYRYEKLVDYNKKINIIRNSVISNYSIFWDNKYKEELKKELKFLEEPELMSHKFNEIEGNIMRLLNFKNNLINEIVEDKKKYEIIIDDLKERYANVEKEYKKLELDLNYQNNLINNFKQKEIDFNNEYTSLIGTLFLSIVGILGQNDKLKMNYNFILDSSINKDNIDICLREGERILREKEDLLNNTLLAIKSYQEKDGMFFTKVINDIKNKNKLQKHLLYKKNKMDRQFETEEKVIHKVNRIKLISRKTEEPYHSPQKQIKKVINNEYIKKLEDEELLKYI